MQPAGQYPGQRPAAPGDQRPVEADGIAARQGARHLRRRLGVEEQKIGHRQIGIGGGDIRGRGEPDRLHHRQAEAPPDLLHPARGLVAMELQHVQGRLGQDLGDGLVGGIDEETDLGDAGGHGPAELGRAPGIDRAWAGRVTR